MKQSRVTEPELSRLLVVDKISAGGVEEHIVARPSEREALAARFGLLDLPRLEAHLSALHAEGKMIAVKGTLVADVVQACVVTLEPLEAHISDTIDILFAPAAMLNVGANPPHADEVENEAPEPIVNGVIDLGELVAQHLAVALDPYPRKAGASLDGAKAQTSGGASVSPFAKLKDMKAQKK
jgi:uncharacterized metal-binding protein YceD (DUF177 family)